MKALIKTYRGFTFERTSNGYWLFRDLPPEIGYCSRYFTNEELNSELVEEIICKAIDRMISKSPVFIGDIRER